MSAGYLDLRICEGSRVFVRPVFGMGDPIEALVCGLEVTEQPRTKDGVRVPATTWRHVRENRCLVDYRPADPELAAADGELLRWAYGSQVYPTRSEAARADRDPSQRSDNRW